MRLTDALEEIQDSIGELAELIGEGELGELGELEERMGRLAESERAFSALDGVQWRGAIEGRMEKISNEVLLLRSDVQHLTRQLYEHGARLSHHLQDHPK